MTLLIYNYFENRVLKIFNNKFYCCIHEVCDNLSKPETLIILKWTLYFAWIMVSWPNHVMVLWGMLCDKFLQVINNLTWLHVPPQVAKHFITCTTWHDRQLLFLSRCTFFLVRTEIVSKMHYTNMANTFSFIYHCRSQIAMSGEVDWMHAKQHWTWRSMSINPCLICTKCPTSTATLR